MDYDVIIIGAGAAGLMCAIEAGKRGRKVWLIDHTKKTAEKIRISGGGRCNFTNLNTKPENFISQNPHFCKSALKQYTPHDFTAMVERHNIAYHEKTIGQLFCDDSSQQIIDMLLAECEQAGVLYQNETSVDRIEKMDDGFKVITSRGEKSCGSLVIATGGLSIPKIGATKFGYDVARQFGHSIVDTRAALVPLTFTDHMLIYCKNLTGISADAQVSFGAQHFREGFLFTHRGLSGPSILQISSYWNEGEEVCVNLCPDQNVAAFLLERKENSPKQDIVTALSDILPKRIAQSICEEQNISGRLADLKNATLKSLAERIQNWRVKPSGTEGYRTAEVTLGGVNTDELSSKTMESKIVPGLYFIGEVVDVTGHLGGYNFQWAWSSGYVAGNNV